jgi:hypothetical protein
MLLKGKNFVESLKFFYCINVKFFIFYWYFLRQVLEGADCPGQEESFQGEGNSSENLKIP